MKFVGEEVTRRPSEQVTSANKNLRNLHEIKIYNLI